MVDLDLDLESIIDFMYYFKWSFILLQVFIVAITCILLKIDKLRNEFKNQPILLVTAHPDDEAMFFLPSILNLRSTNSLRLLCLSNGNFEGLGKIREDELTKVSNFLNLEGLRIVDDPLLQDGMQNEWKTSSILPYIQEEVTKYNISHIITFDLGGISGHPNHRAVSRAAQELETSKQARVWTLKTTGLIRKYIGILDSLLTLNDDFVTLNVNPLLSWRAMQLHYSQFVWYRRLFVIFSRYSYINPLKEVKT